MRTQRRPLRVNLVQRADQQYRRFHVRVSQSRHLRDRQDLHRVNQFHLLQVAQEARAPRQREPGSAAAAEDTADHAQAAEHAQVAAVAADHVQVAAQAAVAPEAEDAPVAVVPVDQAVVDRRSARVVVVATAKNFSQ